MALRTVGVHHSCTEQGVFFMLACGWHCHKRDDVICVQAALFKYLTQHTFSSAPAGGLPAALVQALLA